MSSILEVNGAKLQLKRVSAQDDWGEVDDFANQGKCYLSYGAMK